MPPTAYMASIKEPKLKCKTNACLVNWALELRDSLRLANADKEALRGWAEAGNGGNDGGKQTVDIAKKQLKQIVGTI